jgi:hypothetical protein
MDPTFDKDGWCSACHRPNHSDQRCDLEKTHIAPQPIVFDIGQDAHLMASPEPVRSSPPLIGAAPSVRTLYDSLCRLARTLSKYEERIKQRDELMDKHYTMLFDLVEPFCMNDQDDRWDLQNLQDRARTSEHSRILKLKEWVETAYNDLVYSPMCKHIESVPELKTQYPPTKEYVPRLLRDGHDMPMTIELKLRCQELRGRDFHMYEINQPLMDKVRASQEGWEDDVCRIFLFVEKSRLREKDEGLWRSYGQKLSFERFEWPDLQALTAEMDLSVDDYEGACARARRLEAEHRAKQGVEQEDAEAAY